MRNKKIIYGLFAVAACAIAAALFHELSAWLADGTGAVLAAAGAAATAEETVRGTVTTTKEVKDDGTVEQHEINRPTISKKLTKINPSLFPMDTLLRHVESVQSKSHEYKYYSVRGRGVQSKVTAAYTVTTGSESGAKQLSVANAHIFSADTNVLLTSVLCFEDKIRMIKY